MYVRHSALVREKQIDLLFSYAVCDTDKFIRERLFLTLTPLTITFRPRVQEDISDNELRLLFTSRVTRPEKPGKTT